MKIINKLMKIYEKNYYRLFLKCKIAKRVELSNSKIGYCVNLSHDCSLINSNIDCRSSIGRFSKIRDASIGKFCSISYDVSIGAVNHPMNRISTNAFSYRKIFRLIDKDISMPQVRTTIGNDVWIGTGAIILSGVTIGNGAIIGAGSVVTKDVEPYSIVVGVPAKILKYRFKPEIIEELNKIEWWNFSDKIIKENINLFQNELNNDTIDKLKKIRGDK